MRQEVCLEECHLNLQSYIRKISHSVVGGINVGYIMERSERHFAEAIMTQVVQKISDQILDHKLIKEWFFSEPVMAMILDRVVKELTNKLEIRSYAK